MYVRDWSASVWKLQNSMEHTAEVLPGQCAAGAEKLALAVLPSDWLEVFRKGK
jgi:hypothetical protein